MVESQFILINYVVRCIKLLKIKEWGLVILKKTGLLNRDISALISKLGHQDTICISDAGLAIPDSVNLIDVSLKDNVPRFIDVLKLIEKNLFIEKILLTEELKK